MPAVAVGIASPRSVQTADRLEQNVLDLLNATRLENGLPALQPSDRLAASAEAHSLDMVGRGYFAHDSPDGTAFWQRIRRFYPKVRRGRWTVGENLIWRAESLSAWRAVRRWLASPAHRENLLRPSFREVGVGAVRAWGAPGVYGRRRVVVITVDFGAR
jgi:uncharacterized protein YkwD